MQKYTALLSTFCLSFALVACSDDDGQAAVCGNGQVEGAEACDLTNLDGQSCATVPGGFTGGTLSCTSSCTFDTSLCTSGQEECGNDVQETGEQCDGSDLDSATCQSVGNYVGGTLGCTGTCTYDTSQCIANANCGNGNIDTDEECDGVNLDSNTCSTVGDFSGGTLTCAGDCTFNTSQCVPLTCGNGALDSGEECDDTLLGGNQCDDVGPYESGQGTLGCRTDCTFDTSQCVLTPSGEIQQVIEHMDQTGLTLPLSGAYVTYITPGIGSTTNDPAGFTLQVEAGGPAIFVAVAPSTLSPVPAVGDLVSLTVTETATVAMQPRVTALTGFARTSQGFNVTTLVQDVTNAADLVSALDSRTSELVTATITITGSFVNAGQGFVKAEITTDAVTAAPLPTLRMPSTLRQSLGLDTGCMLTVTATPLWRFDTEAEIGVWYAADITTGVCNGPQVVSAVATNSTTVVVTFSRSMDDVSVLTNGSQFSITDGTNPLTVSAAAVTGTHEVTLTTASQTGGQLYTVSVTSTVEDIFGTGVDQTANTADFYGFEPLVAQLYLWELDSDTQGQDVAEFVEIWNNTGAAVDFTTQKHFLLFLNGGQAVEGVYYAMQLTGTLAANGIHLVANPGVTGANQTFGDGTLQNGQDGVLLVRCDACTGTATQEFPNNFDVTTNATFTTSATGGGSGSTATKVDGIAYDTDDADDAALMSKVGVSAQWDEGDGTVAPLQSLQRIGPNVWTTQTPTPGTL